MTSLAELWGALVASAFMHTLSVIVVAFVLGLAIGFERQWRQRTAGLRTNVPAILVPTTARDADLDAVVTSLKRSPLIRSATWTVGTTS